MGALYYCQRGLAVAFIWLIMKVSWELQPDHKKRHGVPDSNDDNRGVRQQIDWLSKGHVALTNRCFAVPATEDKGQSENSAKRSPHDAAI